MRFFETRIQKKQWPICKNRDSQEHFLGRNASEITPVWLLKLCMVENREFCSTSFRQSTAKFSDPAGYGDWFKFRAFDG